MKLLKAKEVPPKSGSLGQRGFLGTLEPGSSLLVQTLLGLHFLHIVFFLPQHVDCLPSRFSPGSKVLSGKKDEISTWRAGRGETAAFNKMGERREAQHLDQGGKSEVREDTQLTYARSYRHTSPPQWHTVLHALDSDILDTCINLPDSRFFSPLHLRITGTKHFSFLFALLQEKL